MRKLSLWLAVAAIAAIAGTAEAAEKVKIGTEGAYPPFNWIDSDGNLQGFDVDIAKALCEEAKFECEFVVQDWDGMIPGLEAKKYDAIIASMSITEERKQKVDFTGKYYNTPAKFIAAKGAGIDISPEGLQGKTVGVQRATIHENFIRDKFPGAEVKAYGTQDEANADLVAGRVDLVMADAVALDEGFLKTPEGAGFEFVGPNYDDPAYHGEGAGIAIRKGEDALRQAFDDAIKAIRASGKYDEIQKKYFAYDVYGEPAM